MKPAAAPLAEARGLSVDFVGPEGTVHAVKDASWVVHDGETLAIVGESGSGKSVSVEAFTGTLQMPPARIVGGQLLFRGEDLLQLPAARRRAMAGKDIAMIFQDTLGGLNPVLPIGWQVAETARIHGVGRAEANERALELLTKVGIPDAKKRFRDHPHELSGGQRQRVMIAIALALNPSLVIADEPTSALDATVQAQILALLKSLQEERGSGMVLVTHDMGVVSEFADRVVVMKAGEIVKSGTTAAVLNRPSHPYVKSLLEAVPGRLPAHTTKANPGPVLMEVDEVRKTYASLKAVDGVSFSLRQGETIGIVGESGSGKSTLVRLLLALEPPSSGSVSFRGEDINRMNRASSQQLRRHVQAVFQDPSASLNPLMTVRQIISEPWEIYPGLVPRSSFDTRVAELLLQVGLLPEHARRHPHQFSGGQQQRIAIARALAMQPDVIICDEAVSALDVTVQAQIMQLLTRLRDERGISYIFIAHNLAIVRDFATRALVMYKGGVVEEGSIDAVFERPQHPYTKRLLASSFMMGTAPQGLQDAVLS